MPRNRESLSREQIEVNTSIKDFPNVLKRIPLNIYYAPNELEFEFALSWHQLKPLLDKNCQYEEIEGGKIKIISHEPKPPEMEPMTPAQIDAVKKLFIKDGKYGSINLKTLKLKFSKEEIKLLGLAVGHNFVIIIDDKLVLHRYLGGKYHPVYTTYKKHG